MNKISFLIILAMAFFTACQKEDVMESSSRSADDNAKKSARTFYGHAVPIGNGNAKTFYTENAQGEPVEVGVILHGHALNGLSETMQSFSIPFHKKAEVSGYTHVLFDWNPQGHDPMAVYGSAHFDFHFYRGMTENERLTISATDSIEFANIPAPVYQPPSYLFTGTGVAQMGVHWIDTTAPEFNGGIFTKTFIYGSYDGEFVFYEPMITLDYLLTQPNDIIPIAQPQAFMEDGYYPMNYKIKHLSKPNEYIISLDLSYMQGQ